MKREIEIPEDLEVEVDGKTVRVEKDGKQVEKVLKHPLVKVEKDNDNIVIRTAKDNKKIKSVAQTFESKIRSAIRGVREGFEYRLKIVYRHFPMDVKVKDNVLEVSNFLGEKSKRTAKILEGVEVEVKDEDIWVKGADKEKAGQTAANIEQEMQSPPVRDRRIFEDGIYIVEKPKT